METIEIRNLSFTYPNSDKNAVRNINLCINKGEFVLLCGRSGCGKTTLLRCIKKELTPHGIKEGEVLYGKVPIEDLDPRTSAAEIGYVSQNPENQTVTDKVWHELAFGLESLGLPSNVIRRRVAEISSFLGISEWFRMDVDKLSGGQRQKLVLASVMVMQPKVLVLDEPTSQLDPIAATEFIETLKKINSDLGVTVILSEHRLEEVFQVADRVVIMDKSEVIYDGIPRKASANLEISKGFPAAMRIYNGLGFCGESPLTVKEGREFIDNYKPKKNGKLEITAPEKKEPCVSLENIWFKYEKQQDDILRGLSLCAFGGELLCIVGGNAAGKSTALSVLSGIKKPHRGIIRLFGKSISKYKNSELYNGIISILPQSPQTLFVCDSVAEELSEVHCNIEEVLNLMELKPFLNTHPFDLSGGEQQRLAFAKILLKNPKIILLDEPTKGLDASFKEKLAKILKKLTDSGKSIIMATHDLEFAASYADRCAMMFDGEVISSDYQREFFSENSYYTTHANRIIRHIYPKAITVEDVLILCKKV